LDAPVVAIAQSLGGQVLSNYIYDYQKAKGDHPVHSERRPAVRKFLGLATLRTFITTGCNIPLFVAGYPEERVEAINPAFLPAPFRWINFYDKDDVLGWPLRPLMGGYETLVEDREIQAGQGLSKILASWNPYSHTQYWKTDAVVDAVETALREAMTAGSPPHALPSAEGTAERNA
jgi:hypothetical protein